MISDLKVLKGDSTNHAIHRKAQERLKRWGWNGGTPPPFDVEKKGGRCHDHFEMKDGDQVEEGVRWFNPNKNSMI